MSHFLKKGRYSSYVKADLPHPKLAPEIFLILHQVLARALAILREEGQPLATMHEDSITSALARVIENRLRQSGEVAGFIPQLFEHVVRQYECDSFDGAKQRERPDLFFPIRQDGGRMQSDQWGVFTECKPVDADHFAGADYCEKGLVRFIRGRYAWAMQDALMVAYARAGRTIDPHLATAMASRPHLRIRQAVAPLAGPASGARCEALHRSEHERPFEWTEERGPACPITVYHSWHDCGEPTILTSGQAG